MKEKLEKLLDNAYAPYSNFKIACIIITNDNQEFVGVNVENASYGATICAERSAVVNAISHGYKKGDFKYFFKVLIKASTLIFLTEEIGIISLKSYNFCNLSISANKVSLFLILSILVKTKITS